MLFAGLAAALGEVRQRRYSARWFGALGRSGWWIRRAVGRLSLGWVVREGRVELVEGLFGMVG